MIKSVQSAIQRYDPLLTVMSSKDLQNYQRNNVLQQPKNQVQKIEPPRSSDAKSPPMRSEDLEEEMALHWIHESKVKSMFDGSWYCKEQGYHVISTLSQITCRQIMSCPSSG